MIRRGPRIAALAIALSVLAARADAARLLVMPFDNTTRDGRVFWLTEAAAVLLTDSLNALGEDAITRDERVEAFERLQVPPATSLTDATVIRLGELVGAADVIIGSLQMDNNELVVRARSIALEAGRVHVDATERGPVSGLFDTFERLARRIAPSARPTESVARARPSLGAFEDYVKGLLAETPETAVTYLTAALAEEPRFDRARLALWSAFSDQGEYARALAAVSQVPADSPLSRRARYLAGLSQIDLKKYDDAFATFRQIADEGRVASALNNLGVIELRRRAVIQTGQATGYFNQARMTDPDDPDYFFNLGYAYWLEHDTQAAIYWLRETVRRNPTDGEAHFVLGAALQAGGNASEAGREKELARRLSSSFADWDKRPAAEPVPKGLARIKPQVAVPHPRGIEPALAGGGQRDQQELARFYLDRGRRLFQQEKDRDALADLNRALYLSPYLAEAHLLVGRLHLRNGRPRDAVDALKISLWSAESADAHGALADAYLQVKESALARAEAERALAMDPSSADARRVIDQAR